MGRKPLGKTAMSAAERFDRWARKRYGGKAGGGDAARIAELEQELAALRKQTNKLQQENAKLRELRQQDIATMRGLLAEDEQTHDWEREREEAHEHAREDARERAKWGGRPKSLVIDDIKRLLRGRLRCSDDARQTIIDTLAPHVRDQANIERGISRKVFRKVWAELHTDRNPANKDAFIAFTALDGKNGGKPNRNTIVIADDKVRSMSDYWRKREERSERARAKRKAK